MRRKRICTGVSVLAPVWLHVLRNLIGSFLCLLLFRVITLSLAFGNQLKTTLLSLFSPKIKILICRPYIFAIEVVRRNCQNIKQIHRLVSIILVTTLFKKALVLQWFKWRFMFAVQRAITAACVSLWLVMKLRDCSKVMITVTNQTSENLVSVREFLKMLHFNNEKLAFPNSFCTSQLLPHSGTNLVYPHPKYSPVSYFISTNVSVVDIFCI